MRLLLLIFAFFLPLVLSSETAVVTDAKTNKPMVGIEVSAGEETLISNRYGMIEYEEGIEYLRVKNNDKPIGLVNTKNIDNGTIEINRDNESESRKFDLIIKDEDGLELGIKSCIVSVGFYKQGKEKPSNMKTIMGGEESAFESMKIEDYDKYTLKLKIGGKEIKLNFLLNGSDSSYEILDSSYPVEVKLDEQQVKVLIEINTTLKKLSEDLQEDDKLIHFELSTKHQGVVYNEDKIPLRFKNGNRVYARGFTGGYGSRASSIELSNPLAPSKSSESMKSEIADFSEPDQESYEAGTLTAGEINDFRTWEMWNDIAESDLNKFIEEWAIRPQHRYTAQLISLDNKPIIDAQVILRDATGAAIWESRSDNTGKAELWASPYQIEEQPGNNMFIEVNYGDEKNKIESIDKFQSGINFIRVNEYCGYSENVDVVFTVDATGSMRDEINYLKSELLSITDKLENELSNKNIRTGSIFYRDKGEDYLTRMSPLTNNFDETSEFIEQQSAKGGGDFPEAVDAAFSTAINDMNWSESATARIMFLILDADPHKDAASMEKLRELTAAASIRGIRIVPLTASGIKKGTEYIMRNLALLTNGTYLFLTDDSGVGNDHIEPSTNEGYDVELMNNLLVRIVKQFSETPSCEEDELYADDVKDDIYNDGEIKTEDIAELINVYPNPTSGPLTIESSDEMDELFIVDMNGKILMRRNNLNGSANVDLSPFPNGIYFVKFSKERRWSSLKVQLMR